MITKFDTERSPILALALTGDRSPRELTELADKVVKLQLERCLGVGEVDVRGGLERAISCLLYTSPSPRDRTRHRMPSPA